MDVPDWLDRSQWPYPPRWLNVADGRIHYVDVGQGPTVVLVHGTPTWSFEWRHVLGAMTDSHRLLAVDHLGFGLSERPKLALYTPEAHAERFAAWMDSIVPEGRINLVVHDFGGPIALDWALDHPDRLEHLVVVNSWMWSFEDDKAMRSRAKMAGGWLGRWLYRRFNASQRMLMPSAYADRSKLTPAIHEQYLRIFPDPDSRERVLFALARSLLGSTSFFARLWDKREALDAVPMAILWGIRDSAFQPPILDRWTGAFPGATVTRFEDAGHWPHEEVPDRFVAALRQALES